MDEWIDVMIDALVGGVSLWIAARITAVNLVLAEAFIAAGIAALAMLVQDVGWVLSIAALFLALKKFTRADIWPDVLLLVLVSRLFAYVAAFWLASVW